MKQLRLNSHAHCCFTPDGAVLLDLRSDRYSVIPETESRTLALLLGFGASGSDASATENAAQSVAVTLLARDLMTYDGECGRSFEPLSIELGSKVLLDQATRTPKLAVMHVLRFLKSCIVVRAALRFRSFQYAVERARRCKALGNQRSAGCDLKRAQNLVQIARRIRPFVFSARNQCLYDSLVLAEFLAHYALYPAIVVGVATKPFRAHCWVQHQGVVFNSDGEDVTQYTPIMSI